jgi:formin 2
MRFRRGKDDGGSTPAPDAATRVEEPAPAPPSPADRIDDPTSVMPTRESEGPAKVLPPSGADRGENPGETKDAEDDQPTLESPAVKLPEETGAPAPSAADREKEPAKVLPPPTPGARVEAPPPTAATRVESPAPSAAARVESPAASAATRVDAPPPQAGQLVSAAPAGPSTACPQCGAPAEAGQEMCIVCGARISAGPGGRKRGWVLPAALAAVGVLLLGTAAAFGIVELTKDDEVKKGDVADLNESQPTTQPPPPPANTTPTEPAPNTPPTTPTTPDTPAEPDDTTPPTTPDAGASIAEWPSGRTAYTVVLVSATSRNAADAKAEQAIKRGIEAGVLRSDDFSTLRAGYWVVFAGQYDTSEQATRAADRYAEEGFGGGYPRQVKPK